MVKFEESTHTYTNKQGQQLISVTQLMRKHGLAPDYSAVPSETLNRAAERGTMIHAEIDKFNKEGEIGFTAELHNFKDYIERTKNKVIKSEFIVNNDIVAGTVDLLLEENGEKIIADIKTTSTLHKDAVSWQLSIYAYLTGEQIQRGQAFHFDKEGNLNVVDIPLKTKDEVEKLMEAERTGWQIYKQELKGIPAASLIALEQAERIIEEMEARRKETEEQVKNIKEAIMKAMADNGVKTFDNGKMRITYVEPSTRATIDSAKLKKEQPEIAKQYEKTSTTKASIRITLKGE